VCACVQQMTEICLSLFACIEMAYYGYLYSKIEDKEHYQIATGFAKSGMLSGTCVGGILGQLVVYFNNCNYSVLPYYSLACTVFEVVYFFCILLLDAQETSNCKLGLGGKKTLQIYFFRMCKFIRAMHGRP